MAENANVVQKIKIDNMAPGIVLMSFFPPRLKEGIGSPKVSNFFNVSNTLYWPFYFILNKKVKKNILIYNIKYYRVESSSSKIVKI